MIPSNLNSRNLDVKYVIDIVNFGKSFTDRIIINSMKFRNLRSNVVPARKKCSDKGKSSDFEVTWPTCGQINTRTALQSIENFMKKWNKFPGMKDWMFYVEFQNMRADDWSHSYIYEVMWSVPTPAYPEPQVTVSVYFCIEASKVKPSSFPVDVTYVFEGNKFVHRPNIPFQPKWLYDILDMKTMLFKSITF